MPDKRKSSMSSPSAKRPRLSHENEEGSSQPYEQPRQNNVYGQKGAFPGLDDGGDELFYGPADDGLEYLRMVRSEANALPTLFLARNQPSDTQESRSSQQNESEPSSATKPSMPIGFFAKESAYVAPAVDTNKPQDVHSPSRLEELYPSAQISYYNLLRHRFILLRSTLRCSPPAEAIRALDDLHPISLPHNAGAAHKEWRRLLMAVNPQMVQVACMDMDSVLEVLEILARMMSDVVRSEDPERIRRIGAWAWALLGKCREVGQLATEEVGIIRNLGKRAATILRKVQETENNRSQETESSVSNGETEEDGLDDSAPNADQTTNEAEAQEASGSATKDTTEVKDDSSPDASLEQSELEAAKAALQARLQNSDEPAATSASLDDDYLVKQTRALLDMVITVVGEFYGQRDLLEAREIWI